MPQQPRYLSTDPNAGLAATPPPAAPAGTPTYLSTDPLAGGPGGGRGRGPGGIPRAATGGRGGVPSGPVAAALPPEPQYYPGGWKAAAQDFGGMVGGGLATMAATAALPAEIPIAGLAGVAKALPWAARAARGAIGVVGAGAGGATAAAATGSPLTASGPNSTSTDTEDSVAAAFKRQAEMEAMGLGAGWAFNAAGRRLIGSRVARNARDWLGATREASMEDARRILEQSQDAIHAHTAARAKERIARTDALVQAADDARAAQGQAMSAEATARASRQFGKEQGAAVGRSWPGSEAEIQPVPAHAVSSKVYPGAIPPPPNYPANAAQDVAKVVSGPAQRSLDQLGQAVEASAQSGPSVAWGPIKAKLRQMHAATQPAALQEAEAAAVNPAVGYFSSPEQARAVLEKAGIALEPGHPLPGVLGKLEQAGDAVTFSDAHKFKRMLDDAIGWKPAGAVHAPAKKQIAQITKGIRGEIRTAMSGHAPYAQATQAYKDAATLFSPHGLARQVQAVASTNPERLLTLVKPSEPTKFRMLKEVLTEHAAAGGGEEGVQAGQEAWDAVRSTVIYKHLIQPGLANFDSSVAKMHPEFLHLLTEDGPGRGVFNRLQQMSDAVKTITANTEATTEMATAAGQAARGRQRAAQARGSVLKVEGQQVSARRAAERVGLNRERQIAQRGVAEAGKPTAAEKAFDQSSLASAPPPSQVVSEGAYAAAAPVGSPRQLAGTARLFLKGPKVNDLIRWASLSPTGTQAFVRAVTSPAPGQALAALMRLKDWMGGAAPPDLAPGHTPGGGGGGIAPPPGPPAARAR